jgi:hypothetical protein
MGAERLAFLDFTTALAAEHVSSPPGFAKEYTGRRSFSTFSSTLRAFEVPGAPFGGGLKKE